MAEEASWRAMEVADEIKEEGTEVMPTATPEPRGVEAMKTGKGNPPQSAGIVARKAIGRASAGRSAPIRREPGPDQVLDIPRKEIGSVRVEYKCIMDVFTLSLGQPKFGPFV